MRKQFMMTAFFKWTLVIRARCFTATSKTIFGKILLLMLCFLGWASTAQAAIPAAERAVLTNLYASTNGASWTNKTNWNGGLGTECSWYGVLCDVAEIHVTGISLISNNLVGTVTSLSGLTALQYFQVQNNQLTGSIPSLSGLTALYIFTVANNQLTGSIPPLSGLTALRYFQVQNNQLAGSIPSLSGLTDLEIFNVSHNQLTGSIPSLSGLTALKNFYVNANRLTGPVPAAPASLGAGESNLCGNSLVSSGNPAIDAAWVTAQNTSSVAAGNWLACQTAVVINPVFPMVVSGSITPTVANITADIKYRPEDVGTTGSVYVFALAPATLVKNAVVTGKHLGPVTNATAKDTPLPCVLAQLTSSGQLTAASSSSLQAYLTGVLGSQGASISVLNGVSTALIQGSVFYVGYGPNSTSVINNGINRSAVTVPGPQTCEPQAPQTGWWWNKNEGGRGFSIETQDNHLFMAGYLYDESGRATWTISGGLTSLDGSFFNSALLSYANGQTLTGPYKAPGTTTTPGQITLTFTDARNGTLIWPGGAMPIERFDSQLPPSTSAPPAFAPENGWWWNKDESGRGYFLEFKNSFAFIAGYMYDASGNPLWYLSSGTMPVQQTFQGSWSQYANGQTMMGAYKPATPINTNVGALSIQFQDTANATMTLGGRQVPITRFKF